MSDNNQPQTIIQKSSGVNINVDLFKTILISSIFGFILGCIVAGAIGYVVAGNNIRQLNNQLGEYKSANSDLSARYTEVTNNCNELTERLASRQKQLDSASAILGEIQKSSGNTIQELRNVITKLKELKAILASNDGQLKNK